MTLAQQLRDEAAQLERWLRGDRLPIAPGIAPGVPERVETRMYVLREIADRLEATA
jgi:hypothetical protein